MPVTVYFATNRAAASAVPSQAYGHDLAPDGRLLFGTTFVTDANLDQLLSGSIDSLGPASAGGFSAGDAGDIAGSGKDVLVFVHGFANSFADGITRAAFNQQWFAASGMARADTTVIAFTWPSAGVTVNPGDIVPGLLAAPLSLLVGAVGHFDNPMDGAYLQDRARATQSGPAFLAFLRAVAPVLQACRDAGRRVFLLAHSMGHVVVSEAVQAMGAPPFLFDEFVSAAADVNYAADPDGSAPPAWLLRAPTALGRRTSVYYSPKDDIVGLSARITGFRRLGHDGPARLADATVFPEGAWHFADCSLLTDNGPNGSIDNVHQYYRRIPQVREDIAAVLAGAPMPRTETLQPPPGS